MWSNYSEASKSAARDIINSKPTAETYKRTLNIDTRFRDNYYKTDSTNFHVSLPIRIKGVTKMKLCSLELPFTIYNISASQGNNYFFIGTSTGGVSAYYKVTLPDGNYTANMLQTELNARLEAASAGTFEAIIDSRTKRVVISLVSNTNELLLNFNSLPSSATSLDSTNNLQTKLGWMLGFRFGLYEGNSSFVSEAPYILKSPRYIFLRVDDYNNTSNDSMIAAFNSSIATNNILAKISNAEHIDDNIFMMTLEDKFVSGCKERTYSGPVDIEKLRIQLIDEYGRIVNLNGSDFSFSLEFICN